MAINKKLISFATQAQFDIKLNAGDIDNRSIVFIEDKKRIWTHGVYFDTSWNYITGTPDTYTPSAHTHGPITNDGKIGTLTNRIIETTTGGLLTHVAKNTAYNRAFGTGSGTVAQGNDSRINNGQSAFTRTTNAGITGAYLSNITELDTPPVGARFISSTPSTHSSYPAGMSYPMGIEVGRSAAVSAQLVIGHSNSGTNGNMAFRSKSGDSMAPWRSVWDNVNLTKLTQLTNDLPNFNRTVAGLVPAPGAATTTRYLREDGTWVIPPNTGDTHWTTGIRAGASGTNSNSVANDPFIKVLDNTTYRSQVQILGGTNITAKSDATGKITIDGAHNHDTVYVKKIGDTMTGSLTATSFVKSGVTAPQNYLLQADGGHILKSSFSGSGHTHNYLPLTGGAIDGSLDIKRSTSAIPALGARNSSLYITANSLYGMQFGIIGSGVGFIQQGRTDGTATSYSLSLQPSGGNVLINNKVAYHAGNIPTWNQSTTGNAATASAVSTSAENTGTTSRYILFANSASGNQALKTDTGLKYVPSTNTITATLAGKATSAGDADTVNGQKFNWSNSSNSPTYLWGANANGTAFLASRADISVKYATSAGSSTTAAHLPTAYVGGVKPNPQTYFNNTVGLKVAMTGVAGSWSDTLWINGYSGGDVKNMIALHTSRQGTPRMWISSQDNTGSTYGTLYEFLTSNNSSVSGNTININGTSTTWVNTHRGIRNNLTSQNNTTESLSAHQGYLLANGSARDSTKLPLSGGNLTAYTETLVTPSGLTFDLSISNVFKVIIDTYHSDTHTFNAYNARQGAHSFTVFLIFNVLTSLVFPTSVKWANNNPPTMDEVNKTYVLSFVTIDSGTTWFGMEGGVFW